MSFIVDIILALIVLIGAIVGLKRGFILTVAKPVKFVLCLIIAFSLASSVATEVVEPMVGDALENQMTDFLTEKIEESQDGEFEIPTLIKLAAGVLDIDLESFESAENYADAMVSSIAQPIIHLVSTVIAFFILYFVSKIVLGILLKLLNAIFDRGIIGALNKALGLIFSTFFAIVIAWCAASLFEFVINTSLLDGVAWAQEFDGGFIYDFFKSTNPIELLLSF